MRLIISRRFSSERAQELPLVRWELAALTLNHLAYSPGRDGSVVSVKVSSTEGSTRIKNLRREPNEHLRED